MRHVTEKDIPEVLNIFNHAKKSLAAMGIDQWQQSYPNQNTVQNDIKDTVGFVYEEAGTVLAYIAVKTTLEPGYETIDGKWLTADDSPYATVHRIAVSEKAKGKGLSKKVFAEAEAYAQKKGCPSVRVDTHPGNEVMQGLLSSCGYSYCGIYNIPEGTESGGARLCYEKML